MAQSPGNNNRRCTVVAFWTRLTEQLRSEKRLLEFRIQALEKQLYGSRSEKISVDENQLELSSTVFVQVEPPVTADVVVPPDLKKVDRKKPVRRAWPGNIQVVEERLGPADKTCHRCGQDRCLIREEASECTTTIILPLGIIIVVVHRSV